MNELLRALDIRECFLYLHELFDEYREGILEMDKKELEDIFRRYGSG